MSIFLQLTINALIAGSLNALLAAGFSLVYTTNRFVYLAHGAVVTFAAYILYGLTSQWGVPFLVGCALTIGITAIFGTLMYVAVYYPLRRRKTSATILLISSAALMFLIMNGITIFFGAGVKTFDVIPIQEGISVGGAHITPLQIGIMFVALFTLSILWFVVRYSGLGRKLRSVADNPELAAISGINVARIEGISFFMSSVLAAVNGILVGLEQNISPYMGTHLAVSGYTGAIIGGVASIPGAILGGYVLGAIENFGIWFLPSGWKEGIAFTVLLVFLLVRPNGILGVNKGVRNS